MNRIVQSSLPHTGSTLLMNIVLGFLSPEEPIQWYNEKTIEKILISKTHNTNVNYIIDKHKEYNFFFVMSERNDQKIKALISDEYRNKNNILIIDYNEINVTTNLSLDDVIENMFNKFKKFFPDDLILNQDDQLIKKNMKNRIINMNIIVEKFKYKSFYNTWDHFYGIHGNHRNRNPFPNFKKIMKRNEF
jgi:hypothetical protein